MSIPSWCCWWRRPAESEPEAIRLSPKPPESTPIECEPPEIPPLPDVPLRLILQMVIANESTAAMRCRLVSRQWNRVALDQLKLHLYYKPSRERMTVSLSQWINRTHISRPRNPPTLDQLCDSQLLPRVVDMMIVFQDGDFNIQPDLIQLNSLLHRSIDVHLIVKYISTAAGLSRLQFGQLPKMRLVSYSQDELDPQQMRAVEGTITTAQHLEMLAPRLMSTSTLLDLIDFIQQKQKIWELSVKLYHSDNNLVAINNIATMLPYVTYLQVEIHDFNGRLWFLEDFSILTCLKMDRMPADWIQQLSTIRLPNLISLVVQLELYDPMPDYGTFQTWLVNMGQTNMPKLRQFRCGFSFDPLDWNEAVNRAIWIGTFCPSTVSSLTIVLIPDYNNGVEWPLNRLFSLLGPQMISPIGKVQFIFEVPCGYSNDHFQPKLSVELESAAKQAGFNPPTMQRCNVEGHKKDVLICTMKKPDEQMKDLKAKLIPKQPGRRRALSC